MMSTTINQASFSYSSKGSFVAEMHPGQAFYSRIRSATSHFNHFQRFSNVFNETFCLPCVRCDAMTYWKFPASDINGVVSSGLVSMIVHVDTQAPSLL